MAIVACLIVVAGVVSELGALYALYEQDAVIRIAWNALGPNPIFVNVGYIVLAGTGILIVATTFLPLAQLLGRSQCERSRSISASSSRTSPRYSS